MRKTQTISIVVAFGVLAAAPRADGASGAVQIAQPASVGVYVMGLRAAWRLEISVDSPGIAAQHTILDVFTDPVRGLVAESKSTATVPASLELGPYIEYMPMRLVVRSDHLGSSTRGKDRVSSCILPSPS